MTERIADARQRETALDPARSFIVQAPAGSGKTSLLVARYLKLLGAARRPEEVLAITFTRKAAAEMRNRVLAELADAREIAHRLRIETIDAFCMSLARQLPVPAQFGVPPGIAEDARDLYREAAARVVASLEQAAVVRLLAHLDNNVSNATAMLVSMLARRDQWLRKTGAAPTRAELEAALAGERRRLIERAAKLLPKEPGVVPAGSGGDPLVGLALSVLTKSGQWRQRPNSAPRAFLGNELLRKALFCLHFLPPERYEDAQWDVLEAMLALLPLAVAELRLVFAARGRADFTEIAQGAVRALGTPDEPTDLALALDYRIRHILVDEFQDTSISQWELLERLTAGWEPDDGRTLFVVGDPMQSIYRFREAEVGLFLRARREGLPNVKLEPIRLETNFRSQAGIVEWVNASFPRILPAEEDETSGAVPYSPAVAHPENRALAGEAVSWHTPEDHEAEAALVAMLAKQAGPGCALLVRNRFALAEIVPALKTAGARFRAIEIEHLGEKQVVQDLFALTRALTHPGDRIAWLAILRAPWLGLSLEELLTTVVPAKAGTHTVWEMLRDNLFLERFSRILAPALADRQRGTLRDRVEGVWLALGGPACVTDPTDLEDAEAYLDALEELEEAGEVDFRRLEELLDELYARPDVAAGEQDLQIMTIHKAKGLEFDTVIVPGLHRGPGASDSRLLLWKETVSSSPRAAGGDPRDDRRSSSPRKRGPTLLLAPIKATGAAPEPAHEYLKLLEREAEDTESARLLYVAATRAKKRLHLLACPKKTMPPKRSLLACAWPVAEPLFRDLAPPPEASARAQSAAPFLLTRVSPGWRPPAPPAAVVWERPAEAGEGDEIEFSWAGETARHVGVVVHRWLQRIAEDGLEGWDAARVESLRPHFRRDLERRGAQGGERVVDLVVAALRNTLSDERGRWLLGPHAEARNEYRIRSRDRAYVIDRMIREADGSRWVVDYKTSRHEGGDIEGFLDQERERYAAQLDAYAAALGGARRGLYFPLHSGWRFW